MANALTTDRTVVADDDLLASDYNNARADFHSVAEGFYSAGSPDLPLSMQVVGVHWMDPTSKAMRLFRQTSAGADARAKSSPLRPTWHYNDQSGDPADDARVTEGDLLVYDDGADSRFLKACKSVDGVRSFYGLGVRADCRTMATAGSPTQHSDEVRLRGSSWKTSASAAKWRDAVLRLNVESAVDAGDATTLSLSFEGEGVAERTPFAISSGGFVSWLAPDPGGFPILVIGNATGTRPDRALVVAPIGPTPDECEILFSHSNNERMARWVFSAEPVRVGVDAEVLAVQTETAASEEHPTINSPSIIHRGRYLEGESSQPIEAYAQLIVESADGPVCSLRTGFNSGSGTFDIRNDGSATFSGGLSGTALTLSGKRIAIYEKTLDGGSVTWDVAAEGLADVLGCVATRNSAGGGGGGGGPQVVADATDPQALTGVGGTEDYGLALIAGEFGGPTTHVALFYPATITTAAELAATTMLDEAWFTFMSTDGAFTSSPGPVFVNGGAGNAYTWDSTPLDDTLGGAITVSPGNPTLDWNGSAYEATYAEWTLDGNTYEYTVGEGGPSLDSYFFLAGGGGGGGSPPPLRWSADGTDLTVADDSGDSSDGVSVIVWGSPA